MREKEAYFKCYCNLYKQSLSLSLLPVFCLFSERERGRERERERERKAGGDIPHPSWLIDSIFS